MYLYEQLLHLQILAYLVESVFVNSGKVTFDVLNFMLQKP
jgi:hypothetical protein